MKMTIQIPETLLPPLPEVIAPLIPVFPEMVPVLFPVFPPEIRISPFQTVGEGPHENLNFCRINPL